ncbi:protein Wiz isoform X2 [Larimichthys crocea]|uniref:protein Wiz isoform X2 n=1 Tax=Larimichthys crocea TaxID=215358 RepID=UPI000F5D8808|nr:protein Wiz-like isoform X2 [Larimichthys crocea]
MEPEGPPVTPGTSYGPPPFNSAQNPVTFLNSTLKSSCSPNVGDGLMSAKCLWGHAGDEGSKQDEGSQPSTDPGRSAQRRFRSSAFPSSLSWDSDSEKETLDEEELQHFSNPHGLAAHSPGSPSSGLRLDSEDDQEPGNLQHLHSKTDSPTPVEGHNNNNESTKTEEPNTSQLGPTELADSKAWNVSEGAELFLAKVKPKEGCQTEGEADNTEGEKRPKGKEAKEPERDVYSFPGDSDPESPPPAPWAHCTFIQRCRKKRVLLRPFSGLATLKRTLPETGKQARVSPQKSKSTEPTQLSRGGGGIYDFEEVNFGEGAVEEPIKFRDRGGKRDKEEESEVVPGNEIFTCVECSIYFKKQVHLQEHIVEHCQSGAGGGRRLGKGGRFRCVECGWNLPNRLALADHHKRHQESRLKILGEIEKLNENGNEREIQKLDSKVVKHINPDPAIMQDASTASHLGKESDPEIVTSPPLSPAPISTPDADPAVLDSDATPPNSVRTTAQARAVSAYRRRFVCTKCNFSTRTSQALSNHTKTHNRKKPALRSRSPSPGSSSCLASTSLACGHCAFLTSSQTVMREHQKLVHPGKVSISGAQAEETGLHSRSNVGARISKPTLDSDHLSEAGSGSLPDVTQGKGQQGVTASEDSTLSDSTAARPTSQAVYKCVGNRRFSRRGKTWTGLAKFHPRLDDDKLPGSEEEEEQDEDQSTEHDTECSEQEASSPVGVKPHTRARSNTDDGLAQLRAASSLPRKKSVKDEDKLEVEKDGKVFFLRRSSRVTAAPAEIDSDDDDDIDEERVRRFLSEGILDEDNDEIDEDAEVLKSVERKCPYCPDRFHNGIGLANHVRGHLNRVGVSYNVRHFISPEEVNAIEKKFSYQKKKKKVANFDPDTFSVMHCEFCSAGFDTRAGLSSHARAHLRDFGITNWDVTISPIHILRELFSSRPDLVIPTAPPRSPGSSQEEDEEEEEEEKEIEEEGEGIIEVKLEGETSERTLSASDSQPPASSQHCKQEDGVEECEGEEEEAAADDEEELQLDGLNSSPGETDGLSPGEDADSKVHNLKCEVCGAQFETRRGLSSHARSHLRQLGISASEGSGAPIDLLYQIAKERNVDGQISSLLLEPLSAKISSPSAPQKDEDLEDMDLDEKPIPLSVLAKAAKAVPPSCSSTPTPSPGASPALPHSGSPSSVVRKAPISSLLPVSSPLRSPEHKAGGMKSLTSNLSGPAAITTTKPLWAPQENDAPLNLTLEVDPNKDIVCQLCGAWFETRKGLSSHARAHLRHFGVEYSESKGSPIDLLNQLIDTDDFKHKASALQLDSHAEPRGLTNTLSSPKQSPLLSLSSSSSSSSSSSLLYKVTTAGGGSTSKATSSSASPLLGPPAKRLKSSSMRVFRLSSGELMALPHSEPPKEIGCEFCGEYFENRKGLSSHARSHLRQMGITEWSVNGSPIDTLREIITRRGLPCALPLKPLKTPPPSSPGPPRSPLSTSSSPSATLLNRLPFAFARPSSPPQPAVSKSSSAPLSTTSSSGLILKLKPEPVQVEVTTPGAAGRSSGFSGEALNWSSSDTMAHEVEPTRDIRCEFCGEYFENRKGLSSHARSHLRQMGITEWSVNGSPIDTLREVMHKRGVGASSQSEQGVKKESSQGANSPPWENTGGSEGLGVSGYQSSKFRKSPLSLLQSGSRNPKQSLGSMGASATPPSGKFFRISPLAKRPLSEDAQSAETSHSPPRQLKTFSPLPHDFSFKRKPSPDKHGHQDPSCELCGFYFENRKALASHARAHLRQFGVTEWCVNGSPIETLSAWMRSRPQKVLEMHRSYMQGSRSTLKKKSSLPLSTSADSDHILPISSQKASSSSSSSSSSSQWSSSLAVSLVRPLSREVSQGSSKTADGESGSNLLTTPIRPGRGSPSLSRLAGDLPLQAQVARSELNVRLPRGFERRPLKHPSCPDGAERDSGPPKPPRTGTVPALVPKPPSYPLVKLVGKFYTLKCRFCEVEFHGPLSVQEDWIRHLQQHILKMNYNKPAASKAVSAEPLTPADEPALVQASAPASTSTSSTTSTTPAPASTLTRTTAPSSRSPTPPAECAPPVTATEIVKVSEEQPAPSPTSVALPTQTA